MSSVVNKNFFDSIPSFSVILIMAVFIVAGAAMIPQLSIQFAPTIKQKNLSISFGWNGASAKVIEHEVASRLEGVAASIKEVSEVSSVSRQGGGTVNLVLKPGVDINSVRFELAGAIRSIYSKLPEGVTYPTVSATSSGSTTTPLITFTLNADMPSQQILRYAENNIIAPLAALKGVGSVSLSGATPLYTEVRYDPERMNICGITTLELQEALTDAVRDKVGVGIMPVGDTGMEGEGLFVFITGQTGNNLELIPIKKTKERIISLGDVATISVKEEIPLFYNRNNGLNNINIHVYPEKGINTLRLGENIRNEIEHIKMYLPAGFSIMTSSDNTVYISKELNKIYLRTVFSIFILLGFVLLVSRNWRYLLAIVITFIANVFIAFIFYTLLDLELHLYSLAGITVSFSLIIDSSIIMIDHWGSHRNRRAFLPIFAALVTTIGSLTIIFFLPEAQRAILSDFAMVIIVNLTISMFIALFFLPVLMDTIKIREKFTGNRNRLKRIAVCHRRLYAKIIIFGRRRRWIFIILMTLSFGLPVFLLPNKIADKKDREYNRLEQFYNKTIGSKLYQNRLRKPIDMALGGTMRLFSNSIRWRNYYRDPARPELYIFAGMAEGSTVNQLNDIIVMMENYLSQFDQIESFQTSVRNYDDASITVTFKKEFETSSLPSHIKSEIMSKVIDYGGASWRVYGIDDRSFDNNIATGYQSQQIVLYGYNYDILYDYALSLQDELLKNSRVTNPAIYGEIRYGYFGIDNRLSRNEFVIDANREIMARKNIDYRQFFNVIADQLRNNRVATYFDGRQMMNINLTSANIDGFDLWQVSNQNIKMGDESVKFSDFGTVTKRRSGNDIYRHNQQYRLIVAYDFTGSHELQKTMLDAEVEKMNNLLPMGYSAAGVSNDGQEEGASQYWILLIIVVIIYFICAILFESFLQPFVIISIIPVSFTGLFLTFSIFKFRFDQGGFAAMIFLCAIVINAGIYLIDQYNKIERKEVSGLRIYIKAYDTKILPILLTIISSVLGLVPFLTEGESLVFWFAFATGSIGGLIFSIIALYFFLPIFMPMKRKKNKRFT